MSPALADELAAAHAIVVRQHEVLICWRTMYVPAELHFVALPSDMLELIRGSEDYRKPAAGAPPTRLEIASGNEVLEMTIYQAIADGQPYMLAPINRSNIG